MKKVFLVLAVSFISFAGFSQSRKLGSELSIGVNGGLPVGDLSDTHNGVVGGSLKYAYNFDETIAVTVESGYNHFFGKKLTDKLPGYDWNKYPSFGAVPIKAGVRFSAGPFYAEPQLGAAIFTGNADGTAFTYAGNIGVLAGQNFDISVKYEGWSKKFSYADKSQNLGFVGLRLAYNIPVK